MRKCRRDRYWTIENSGWIHLIRHCRSTRPATTDTLEKSEDSSELAADRDRLSQDNSHNNCLPDHLLVFVHGICSGPKIWDTWWEMVLPPLNCDFDILAVRYPSCFWQKCDVESEAATLLDMLNGRFGGYKHITIICHSMGGLIVKVMLRLEENGRVDRRNDTTCEGPNAKIRNIDSLVSDDLDLVLSRLRSIIYLAVPHFGGSKIYTTLGAGLYDWLFWPWFRYVSKLQGAWGYYHPRDQLYHKNAWATELASAHLDLLRRARERGCPIPIVHDNDAAHDGVVGEFTRSSKSEYEGISWIIRRLPWTGHFTTTIRSAVKGHFHQMAMPKAMIWGDVGREACVALDIAFETLKLAVKLDQEEEINEFIRDPSVVDLEASVYDQQTCLDALLTYARARQRRCYVVTGQGLVGKSTVLRRLARVLAQKYLADGNVSVVTSAAMQLPVAMNLRRAKLSQAELKGFERASRTSRGAVLWQAIQNWWVSWATKRRSESPTGGNHSDRPKLADTARPPLIHRMADRLLQASTRGADLGWIGRASLLLSSD